MATKIGLLSGGQRQVVTLLMSTIVTPKLLLLDEHTAALDPATAEKVMAITNDIVHDSNLTTLMITHNMGQAHDNRKPTIMLDSGAIIFDIKEEERKHMTVSDLLDMYSEKKKEEFDNDRILLSWIKGCCIEWMWQPLKVDKNILTFETNHRIMLNVKQFDMQQFR